MLARAARSQDALGAHATARSERAPDRRVPKPSPQGEEGLLPRTEEPSATRARLPADVRFRRAYYVGDRFTGERKEAAQAGARLHVGRVARWSRNAHLASRDHDAR